MSISLGKSITAFRPNVATICVGAGTAVFFAGAYVIFGDSLFKTRGNYYFIRKTPIVAAALCRYIAKLNDLFYFQGSVLV